MLIIVINLNNTIKNTAIISLAMGNKKVIILDFFSRSVSKIGSDEYTIQQRCVEENTNDHEDLIGK
jgi:hypothetical protein